MNKENFSKPKAVKIIVEKVPVDPNFGPCSCHKEGQVFTFDFERCPSDFCASAFHSLWPHLRVLELGGRHPWDAEPGVTRVCCPDANKPVTFKIVVEDKE
jgi:uncharacterized repeat protein (TIGR04076 family)